MRIVSAAEALSVEHPLIVIAGFPGIGKTSIASSWNSLLLDFDQGAHRAENRRDVAPIDSWADVQLSRRVLEPYDGVTIDTVERCLQKLTAAMLEESSKHGANGILHPRSHGILRARFSTWLETIRGYGKDVLVVAHAKEERDDRRTIRVDAPGSAYAELLKRADFIGWITMIGEQRVLDFNPSERWIAKNPAGWPAMKIPPADKCREFMADLFASARAALKAKTEASAAIAAQVETWRREVLRLDAAHAFNAILPRVLQLEAPVGPQVKRLLYDRAVALGVTYDKAVGLFNAPAPGSVVATPAARQTWVDRSPAKWQPGLYSALTNADGAR